MENSVNEVVNNPSSETALEPKITESILDGTEESSILSYYTYLRIKARAIPTGKDVDICTDLGTGCTLIG